MREINEVYFLKSGVTIIVEGNVKKASRIFMTDRTVKAPGSKDQAGNIPR